MDSTRERVRKALDALVYLPVDDAVVPQSSKMSSKRGERPACRIWDRGDLLRRLQTYKANTWFCKPAGAGSLNCARHGWVNTSLDMLTCEFCAAKLHLPIPLDLPSEEVTKLGEGFVERLASSHDSACPWRTVACDPGLEMFPPLGRKAVCEMFAQRQQTLNRLNVLPSIAEDTYHILESSRRTRLQELLSHGPQQQQPALASSQQENGSEPSHAADSGSAPIYANGAAPDVSQRSSDAASRGVACQGSDEHLRRQRLLALTGWSAEVLKPEQAQGADSNKVDATTAALRCAMCDARAGLWNFVPGMAVINQSSSKYAQGAKSPGLAAPVSLPSVDLTTTIAGGDLLHQDSLPKSPGPFGSVHPPIPVFGVRSRRTSSSPQESRQQRHSKPEITQRPGTKQLFGSALTSSHEQTNPEGAQGSIAAQPFGSAAAAAPAFGGPPMEPARAAGSAEKLQRDPSSAENASLARSEDKDVPLHSSCTGAMDAQPPPGPFGRTTGEPQSVFGIEALKRCPPAGSQSKRPREEPPSTGQEDSIAASSKKPRVDRSAGMAAPAAEAAATPAVKPSSNEQHMHGGASAVDSAGASQRGRKANGNAPASESFSFPDVNAREGNCAPSNTPAVKPRPASSKPRRNSFSPLKPGTFEPFDPLQSHRAFCPWVSRGAPHAHPGSQAGREEGRVGWRWCLDSLIPLPGPEEEAGIGQPVDQRTKLLALLRNLC